jgi:hypothetical protein
MWRRIPPTARLLAVWTALFALAYYGGAARLWGDGKMSRLDGHLGGLTHLGLWILAAGPVWSAFAAGLVASLLGAVGAFGPWTRRRALAWTVGLIVVSVGCAWALRFTPPTPLSPLYLLAPLMQ